MAQPTRTGEIDEKDIKDKGLNKFPIVLGVLIASPIMVATAVATYLLFAWARIRLSVIFWLGFVPSFLISAIFWQYALASFMVSWTYTIPSIINGTLEPFSGVMAAIFQQALIATPTGIGAGLLYSSYRWRTRPIWVETVFRMTPKEWLMKKKNIADIQADKNSPYEGMTLGVEEYGKKIVQSDDEARAHTIIFGASGAGKTRTLMSRLRDSIKNGQGAIIIDLKGGNDVPEEVAVLAERYDRKFQHWLFQDRAHKYTGPALDGPAYYDPLGRGDATRRKDLLIGARTNWESEYYKGEASYVLTLIMSMIVANPDPTVGTLLDILKLLSPIELQKRAIAVSSNPIYADIVRQIDALVDEKMEPGRKSAIKGLESQIGVLLNSVAGHWLQLDPEKNNNINLYRAAHEGEIVVFTLDSSSYPDQAKLIANLIIQDLKTVSSELRDNPLEKPVQVVIDEFSAVSSENILGLINKSRDAKMPVTLTTQALGDLDAASDTLQAQLLGIVNSFIIHRANTMEDALSLAGLSGKNIKKRFNESVSYRTGFLSKGTATGKGNIEDVEEFTIPPKQIQELNTGEFFYINKNPFRVVKGQCIMEDPSKIPPVTEPRVNFVVAPEVVTTERDKLSNSSQMLFAPGVAEEPISPESLVVKNPQGGVPPIITNPNADKANRASRPPASVKPVNMDRLKNILNVDPSELLGDDKEVPETPVSPTIPPAVSKPVDNIPSAPVSPPPTAPKPVSKPVMPPPIPPKIGVPSLPGLPTKPGGDKKLPQLPSLPNLKKPDINETSGEVKDDYDF